VINLLIDELMDR